MPRSYVARISASGLERAETPLLIGRLAPMRSGRAIPKFADARLRTPSVGPRLNRKAGSCRFSHVSPLAQSYLCLGQKTAVTGVVAPEAPSLPVDGPTNPLVMEGTPPRIAPVLFPPSEQIQQSPADKPVEPGTLAYELVQGALVRWSAENARATVAPPTAVFLHGILGSRKNWSSFARRVSREFPSWQLLLVDLRCHGESAAVGGGHSLPPHSVSSAAADVLRLIRQLRLVPRILVGHSFGGKVALSMVDQAAKPLAKPVQVWVLDATPGDVHAGGDGEDHPAELIRALSEMGGPIKDRKDVVRELSARGFSLQVSQWMTTNLQKNGGGSGGGYEWGFDLPGIAQMYQSYEQTNLWPLVEAVPEGVRIEFLRAERSLHRWAHGDVTRISAAELRASAEGAGVGMHVLEDAGHWVHADNPEGLFRILSPSFYGRS